MRIIHDFSPWLLLSRISNIPLPRNLRTPDRENQEAIQELRQNLDRCAVLFEGSKVAFPELTTRFL